ncbi:MAG: nuclear transport factor 2 family protein [Actinomycetota bacterium]
MKNRLTGVLHQEDGRWKLVHMHLSVGVPDEEVVDLQRKWPAAGDAG